MVFKVLMVVFAAFVAAVTGQASVDDRANNRQLITFALSGHDIPAKDRVSNVDPYVKVYSISDNNEEILGSTEVVPENEDPTWLRVFSLQWQRGTGQKLKFILKDYDILSSNDVIGEATIDVDQYVTKSSTGNASAPAKEITVPVIGGGVLKLHRTYPRSFSLKAKDIPHLDNFDGLSDPFVDIYWRKGKNGEDHLVASTAVINDAENADFPEVIEFSNYVPGSNQFLNFRVLDSDSFSGNDDIGEVLIEADPFFKAAQRSTYKVGESGNTTLTITPN